MIPKHDYECVESYSFKGAMIETQQNPSTGNRFGFLGIHGVEKKYPSKKINMSPEKGPF